MDTRYTGHLGLKFTAAWRSWTKSQRQAASAEMQRIFADSASRVTLRGAYLTQGFRADTDLFLWMIAESFDDIQDLQLELMASNFGEAIEIAWAFAGITMESEFNKHHGPAFLSGKPPKRYICFYTYSRSADWYLLPAEQRAEMLKEHGMLGREFPDIQTNGVNAFGLGDDEWVLSFEADELPRIVELMRRQRAAEARRYTKQERPFITGRRLELGEALNRLI